MLYSTAPVQLQRNQGSRMLAYEIIAQNVRYAIENFVWSPDDMIPSESALAKQYSVSIGTVKKALNDLVQEKLLYRIQGKGTFVAGSFVRCEKLRYYKTMTDFNEPELETTFQFLGCGLIEGENPACKHLGLVDNAMLVRIDRLSYIDNIPYALIRSYFDGDRFAGLLTTEPERFEQQALSLIIEKDYNTATLAAKELISATEATGSIAKILKLPKNSPLLHITMLSLTHNESVYEYRESFIVPDKKIFRTY